jgi:hypothetical protein
VFLKEGVNDFGKIGEIAAQPIKVEAQRTVVGRIGDFGMDIELMPADAMHDSQTVVGEHAAESASSMARAPAFKIVCVVDRDEEAAGSRSHIGAVIARKPQAEQ